MRGQNFTPLKCLLNKIKPGEKLKKKKCSLWNKSSYKCTSSSLFVCPRFAHRMQRECQHLLQSLPKHALYFGSLGTPPRGKVSQQLQGAQLFSSSPAATVPELQPGEAQAAGRLGGAAPARCSHPGGCAAPWSFGSGSQKPPFTALRQTPATKKVADPRRQGQRARRHFRTCCHSPK